MSLVLGTEYGVPSTEYGVRGTEYPVLLNPVALISAACTSS